MTIYEENPENLLIYDTLGFGSDGACEVYKKIIESSAHDEGLNLILFNECLDNAPQPHHLKLLLDPIYSSSLYSQYMTGLQYSIPSFDSHSLRILEEETISSHLDNELNIDKTIHILFLISKIQGLTEETIEKVKSLKDEFLILPITLKKIQFLSKPQSTSLYEPAPAETESHNSSSEEGVQLFIRKHTSKPILSNESIESQFDIDNSYLNFFSRDDTIEDRIESIHLLADTANQTAPDEFLYELEETAYEYDRRLLPVYLKSLNSVKERGLEFDGLSTTYILSGLKEPQSKKISLDLLKSNINELDFSSEHILSILHILEEETDPNIYSTLVDLLKNIYPFDQTAQLVDLEALSNYFSHRYQQIRNDGIEYLASIPDEEQLKLTRVESQILASNISTSLLGGKTVPYRVFSRIDNLSDDLIGTAIISCEAELEINYSNIVIGHYLNIIQRALLLKCVLNGNSVLNLEHISLYNSDAEYKGLALKLLIRFSDMNGVDYVLPQRIVNSIGSKSTIRSFYAAYPCLEEPVKTAYVLKELVNLEQFLDLTSLIGNYSLDTIIKRGLLKIIYGSFHDESNEKGFRIALGILEYTQGYGDFSLNRDKILKFIIDAQVTYDFSSEDVTSLLQLLTYVENPIDALTSLDLFTNFLDIQAYLATRLLQEAIPNNLINADIYSKFSTIEGINPYLVIKLITRIRDIDSISDYEKFLDYLSANKINAHHLNDILSDTTELNIENIKSINELNKFLESEEASGNAHQVDIGFEDLKLLLEVSIILGQFLPRELHSDTRVVSNLSNYVERLIKNEWERDDIRGLLSYCFPEMPLVRDDSFFILESITNYKLKPILKDELYKLIGGTKNITDLLPSIGKISREHYFSEVHGIKSVDQLLNEIGKLNIEDVNKIIVSIDSDALSKQFTEVKEYSEGIRKSFLADKLHENDSGESSFKAIGDWNEKEIKAWCLLLNPKDVDVHLTEVLAVVKRGAALTLDINLRDVQVLSILVLLSGTRIVLDIKTGEGKSITIAAEAIILGLKELDVDVITSSEVLAEEGVRENKKLYELFGMSVNCNSETQGIPKNLIYGRPNPSTPKIVYGDLGTFIGDKLSNDYYGDQILGNRRQATTAAIIDEFDQAALDRKEQLVMLSKPMPTFDQLSQLLVSIWQLTINLQRNIIEENSRFFYRQLINNDPVNEAISSNSTEQTYEYTDITDIDIHAFKTEVLIGFINNLIKGGLDTLGVPKHLERFVKIQVEDWASSAVIALDMKEGDQYVIVNVNGKKRIKVLEASTGVTMHNTQLSNGLHQFLQIKHRQEVTSTDVVNVFRSIPAFLKGYLIVSGVTGSTGSYAEKGFVNREYNIKFATIPTFQEKRVIKFPTLLVSEESHYPSIINAVKHRTKEKMPVLIPVETINEANILIENLNKDSITRKFTRSDTPEVNALREPVRVGEAVVSTRLAVRGTDIKLEDNDGGGLSVIITSFETERGLTQIRGRTGRAGNYGTVQSILSKEDCIRTLANDYPWVNYTQINLPTLHEWANLAQEQKLFIYEHIQKPRLDFKDELFSKFTYLGQELKTEYTLSTGEISQLEEFFGVWLLEQDKILDFKSDVSFKLINITETRNNFETLRNTIFKEFEKFSDDAKKDLKAGTFIKNPIYCIPKAIANQDLTDLDKFTDHSMTADSSLGYHEFALCDAKVRILLSKLLSNGEKQEDRNQKISDALRCIYSSASQNVHTLQALLTQYKMTSTQNQTAISENELSQKITRKIDLFKQMKSYAEANINVVSNLRTKGFLEISKYVALEDAAGGSYDDSEKEEFRAYEVENFYTLGAVYPPKDWFGTAFAFIVGSLEVFGGFMLAATGVGAKWASDLISEGINSLYATIKSIIKGIPIDFSDFLVSKLISYAVRVISAGITYSVDKIAAKFPSTKSTFKFLGLGSDAKSQVKSAVSIKPRGEVVTVSSAFTTQNMKALAKDVGTGLMHKYGEEVVHNKTLAFIKKHTPGVEKDTGNQIRELFSDKGFLENLKMMLKADAWTRRGYELKQFYFRSEKIAQRMCKSKVHKNIEDVSMSASSRGSYIMAAEVTFSTYKASIGSEEFAKASREEAQKQAKGVVTSRQMMIQGIGNLEAFKAKFLLHGNGGIKDLTEVLVNNKLMNEREIRCGLRAEELTQEKIEQGWFIGDGAHNITALDWGKHDSNKKDVRKLYEHICAIEHEPYVEEIKIVESNLISILTGTLRGMIDSEIIDPITKAAYGYAREQMPDLIEKAQKFMFPEERKNSNGKSSEEGSAPGGNGGQEEGAKPDTQDKNNDKAKPDPYAAEEGDIGGKNIKLPQDGSTNEPLAKKFAKLGKGIGKVTNLLGKGIGVLEDHSPHYVKVGLDCIFGGIDWAAEKVLKAGVATYNVLADKAVGKENNKKFKAHLKNKISPIVAEGIAAYNTLSPEQKKLVNFAVRVADLVGAGKIVTQVGKAAIKSGIGQAIRAESRKIAVDAASKATRMARAAGEVAGNLARDARSFGLAGYGGLMPAGAGFGHFGYESLKTSNILFQQITTTTKTTALVAASKASAGVKAAKKASKRIAQAAKGGTKVKAKPIAKEVAKKTGKAGGIKKGPAAPKSYESVVAENLDLNTIIKRMDVDDSVIQTLSHAEKLKISLAHETQRLEIGRIMAGAGHKTPFRGSQEAARKYGGSAKDYVKKSSSAHNLADTSHVETHWVENIVTKRRYDYKVKIIEK